MNFACVVAYIFLILELLYLSIAIFASKIPIFRDTRRKCAKSLTASRLAEWFRLISVILLLVLVIPTFLASLYAVASLTAFPVSLVGKTYDAYKAGKFLQERNMYLSGSALVLYIVLRSASFERVVIEEPKEQEGEGLVQIPAVNINVVRNL